MLYCASGLSCSAFFRVSLKSGEELAKLVMDKNKWPDRYEAEKLMRKGELKVEKSVQDFL